MSYTALYRKFRPETFDDVKGQEAIVKTLRNQVISQRVGHAYLFCGTRGTGKTSVAKILARAVNCEQPVNGSPCGVCPMCKAIAAGSSLNVIEIDAASNNGVDNIREIREEVAYRPTSGNYKVYIIDEVHMLSIGAFNALLKTLEEPPEYVIFILATTEAHKIPVTILSRCQRYDFKRISVDTIVERLEELVAKEQLDVEDRALRYIARAADGALRDALSLLDQCAAFYFDRRLTYDEVLEVLGAVDTEVFSRLFNSLQAGDLKAVLEEVDELLMEGKELSQLTADFTWYLRNLLLVKSSEALEEVLDMSTENIRQLKTEAQDVAAETLIRYIRILSELANQMRFSTQKRVLLEVTLVKLCRPQMETDVSSLAERLRQLEEKLAAGEFTAAQPAPVSPPNEAAGTGRTEAVPTPTLTRALPAEIKAAAEQFRSYVAELSGSLRVYLNAARISVNDNNDLVVVMKDALASEYLNRSEHFAEVKNKIEEKLGKEIGLVITHVEEPRRFDDQFVDLEKIIHMDIEIEED